MKTCCTCKVSKSLEDFYKRSKAKDGYQNNCKLCANALRLKHYKTDKGREQKLKAQTSWQNKNFNWIKNYLAENPCVDCGEADIIVLEFDHRDNVKKLFNISDMVRMYSLDRIKEEIDKCDVRCCNCHRRRTAKQFNWFDKFTQV